MNEDERWNATIKALEEIAENPRETPGRRRKAQAALYRARGSVDGSSASRVPLDVQKGTQH